VQQRIKESRGKIDGMVLAYLIDRYYRGPIPKRQYYLGLRGLGRELGFTHRRMHLVMQRLGKGYGDVLKVIPGVSHPTLRLANGYYVPEKGHNDRVDWYMRSGRSDSGMLPCEYVSVDSRNGSVGGGSTHRDEYPF